MDNIGYTQRLYKSVEDVPYLRFSLFRNSHTDIRYAIFISKLDDVERVSRIHVSDEKKQTQSNKLD